MPNGADSSFSISLVRSQTDVSTGEVRTPARIDDRILIGRASECDVRIPHKTVSRNHLEVRREEERFVIENLSSRGTTLVQNRPLAEHEVVTIEEVEFYLQVGAFLLQVEPAITTEPFSKRLMDGVMVILDIDSTRRVPVKIAGEPVKIAPIPAQALQALAEAPGRIISFDDILHSVDDDYGEYGGGNVNQIMSYIRRGFREALDEEVLREQQLVDAAIDRERASKAKNLMQYVVQNHYKRGYSLNLRPECIAVACTTTSG